MSASPTDSGRLRFSVFELDLEAGELFKQGRKIALQGQPFQLLVALAKRPGQAVTRDQLRQEIWPTDIVVDFERGLNRAVNKLRNALGDSAETPLLIETLPRIGYRFMGTVTTAEITPAPRTHPGNWWKNWWKWCVATLLILGAVSAATVLWKRSRGKLTEKDQLVLSDFQNSTGDPVFSAALRQGLAIQLRQSPYLSLLAESQVTRALSAMGKSAATPLTEELAREVCVRSGSSAALTGSIDKLGSQYVVGLRARSCATGDILDEEQEHAPRKEDVLNALSIVASRFRTKAGESLATVRRYSAPLAEATTSSLEALRAYSLGRQLLASGDHTGAISHLRRALEFDPKFAMAHALLGVELSADGSQVESVENTRIAYSLRDRASGAERFFIEFSYARQVTGNLKMAQRIAEVWAQTYPRDISAISLLSGFVTKGTGDYEKAIDAARRAIELDPDFEPAYGNLIESNIYLNRFEAAQQCLDRARRRLPSSRFPVPGYYLAFLRDDASGMDQQIAAARGNPILEAEFAHHRALTFVRSGCLKRAQTLWRQAIASAMELNARDKAALYQSAQAVSEALLGRSLDASRSARAALALSSNRDVTYAAALAFVLAGDISQSQALSLDLAQRFPEDTTAHFLYVPTLRARIALAKGDSTHALSELDISEPYDLALTGTDFLGSFGGLYSIQARGEALLCAGRAAQALAEFQKVTQHTGLVFADPIGTLVYLDLARAYKQMGNTDQARRMYLKFFSQWKAADPELPVLLAANREYARLP